MYRVAGVFEFRMSDISQKVMNLCVKQIEQKSSGVCAKTLNTQITAMQTAAHEVFNKEFHPLVNLVPSQLGHLARQAQPDHSPWLPWLTHGAAFVTGAALIWLIVVMVWVWSTCVPLTRGVSLSS